MNNFDGVAGLIMNLDYLISTNTADMELLGSLGIQGLMFSKNGYKHWRKIDKDNNDVCYDGEKKSYLVNQEKITFSKKFI